MFFLSVASSFAIISIGGKGSWLLSRLLIYGPRQAKLVLIAYASSEGSGEPAHFAQSRQNLRCSLIQAVSQEEPSDRKPDKWNLWMPGHAQLKFAMTECSKTPIRLTGLIYCGFTFCLFFLLVPEKGCNFDCGTNWGSFQLCPYLPLLCQWVTKLIKSRCLSTWISLVHKCWLPIAQRI